MENNIEKQNAIDLFDQLAKENMIVYNEKGFKRRFKTLHSVIIEAMLKYKNNNYESKNI